MNDNAATKAANDTTIPLRSVLYMPGQNERALAKAPTLACDAVILDLEDSVGVDAKVEARQRVTELVSTTDFGGKVVTIRVNSPRTPWHDDDVRQAAAATPDAVVVPKVQSAEQATQLCDVLAMADPSGKVALWAMIETPAGVLDVANIARCHERLTALVIGTNDLYAELRAAATADRAAVIPALAQCVLAARSAGVAVLDGVFNDIADTDGFTAEARQGAMLGFDGKTLIHPAQIAPCMEAFSPSQDEVEHARKVVAAWRDADAGGKGVATVDGRMIEKMHVEAAERTIATAR